MKAFLHVVSGAKPIIVRLKLPTVIGRSETVALKVRHARVSRHHCELYEEDGWLVVHDLGSSNGTFIENERIEEPTFLYSGERLRVGGVTFLASYDGAESGSLAANETNEPTEAGGPQGQDLEATESSSVIHYAEQDEGSFLGIEESASAEIAETPRISIDTGQCGPAKPNQSALKKFFDHL